MSQPELPSVSEEVQFEDDNHGDDQKNVNEDGGDNNGNLISCPGKQQQCIVRSEGNKFINTSFLGEVF